MWKTTRRLTKDIDGATAIEYGIIAALVSVVGITAIQSLGESVTDLFADSAGQISAASSQIPDLAVAGGPAVIIQDKPDCGSAFLPNILKTC